MMTALILDFKTYIIIIYQEFHRVILSRRKLNSAELKLSNRRRRCEIF